MGTGIGKDNVNVDKIRYHKIIIMTDADVDGFPYHDTAFDLLLSTDARCLERGYVYIAQPLCYRAEKSKEEII